MQSLLYSFEKAKAIRLSFEAGDLLDLNMNESSVYLLIDGLIANECVSTGKGGNPIHVLAPGYLLGLEKVFDEHEINSSYVALSHCIILGVPTEVFKYWMNQDLELRMKVLVILHKHLEVVENGIQEASQQNPKQRMLGLVQLIKKSGIHGQEIHLKAAELARLCRCTVEVLRREWKDLIADIPAQLVLE